MLVEKLNRIIEKNKKSNEESDVLIKALSDLKMYKRLSEVKTP